MPLTQQDLIDALLARNFAFLNAALAAEFVNQAAQDVIDADRWRFRHSDLTSAPGQQNVQVAGLGPLTGVYNMQTKRFLREMSQADVLARYGVAGMTTPGEPEVYVVGGGAVPIVSVYPKPAPASAVMVMHLKRDPWELGGAAPLNAVDTLRFPEGWKDLFVLRAVVLAYEDHDEDDKAAKVQTRLDLRLQACATSIGIVPREMEMEHVGEWA